ncbi:benzoate/H(+) symporter BenE family transporter [Maritalea porphyrae]|jgi:benzoate membrane transport protein|uniref:benzoate/H(+) symporter BenE family transporter n=1 Tax=Maritalea porphyrae TaxID=880732 RepID=UPI0022AF607E|nr:benzoate/H(+) symporter BenE family transporter [Maritalea porphyrae]MCZ4272337.1 benzoate/H(+) symporter BenE family transporter [Maritalea porphyrae]
MLRDFSPQALIMGLITGFVGFSSSFAIVLQGLFAVGASPEQAASGLTAMCIAMGVCAIILSAQRKMPISVAWSTPGAALMVTSGQLSGGFAAAVGAFLVCATLIIISGVWRPFGRAVEKLPVSLANAMLAGILMPLCFAPIKAIGFDPILGLPIALAWLITGFFNKLMAVPAALLAFILVIIFGVDLPADTMSQLANSLLPQMVFTAPVFDLAAIISLGLPLFLVTMASQNIPGMAVLKANHYQTPAGPLFTLTGVFSALAAPFGSHAVNLAAITAAMCASPDAHPDKDKRYWAAIVTGVVYVIIGLFAGLAITFISLAPAILVEAVAGLALVGAFAAAAFGALNNEKDRHAAAVTFLITGSGVSFFGISGAFWGLLAGIAILGASKFITQK